MTTKKISIVILCVLIVGAVGAYTVFGQNSPKTRLVSALENSDCYLTENEIKATFNTVGDTWGVMEPFAEELIRSGEIEMQGSTVVLMDRGSCISPTEAFVVTCALRTPPK